MFFKTNTKATDIIEKERLGLYNDYQSYQKIESSEKLKNFLALKEKVESSSFQENKKKIESIRYSGSPEEKMVKEFESLEKNSKLKKYFDTKTSNDLDRFKTVEKSGKIQRLKELEQLVNSNKFKKNIDLLKKQTKAGSNPENTKELGQLLDQKNEYDTLKNADEVNFYFKYSKTKAYHNYINIDGSELLKQYLSIKNEISSNEFISRKEYLLDKNRYEKTEDYKLLQEYIKLKEDPDIKLYLKYHETNAFRFFREWAPTFTEDFVGRIDKSKWSFITPIAEIGPGRNFSIKNQLHYAQNEENFYVEDSILTLETKKHKVEGIYWDEQFGFVQKTFNYASGVLHSLKTFKQEYGRFEIKIKASKIKGVNSSISLVNEDEDICIRLFNSNGTTLQGGLITTDHQTKHNHVIKLDLPSKGYVIVTLTWSPDKLEWKINDKTAGVITHNIPHIQLGLRIETEVLKETGNLPHRLDIDWIKCYKKTT